MTKGMAGPSAAEKKEWQAEDDLRTLIAAEKIKKDKDRYAAALKVRTKMLADMQAISKTS